MKDINQPKGVYLRPDKELWKKIDVARKEVLGGVVLSKNDFIMYVLNKYFDSKKEK
jgi:hypothetical protein